MYYGKKKGIIIAIIVAVVVLLIAGGILLYFCTDIFKSNETLFMKYMQEGFKEFKLIENTQMKDIQEYKTQEPYSSTATITFDYAPEEENTSNTQTQKMLQTLKVSMNEVGNVEKLYSKTKVEFGNVNLMNFDFAKSNNIIAIKSDEIVTAYLGIRNENLKVLAQKLGVQDVSQIPNKIETQNIDYNTLLEISDQEIENIQTTYLPILKQNISKESYSKQSDVNIMKNGVNYSCNSYRLDLTSTDLKNIILQTLQTLKEDSITLNLISTKAKLLGLDENYTDITKLTQTIQNKYDQISSSTLESGISLVVYESKGETVLTEFIIKNQAKISMNYNKKGNSQGINLVIDNLSDSEDYSTLKIDASRTIADTESTLQIDIDKDSQTQVTISLYNSGTVEDKELTTTCDVAITDEKGTTTGTYEQKTTFGATVDSNTIPNLDQTNCAILNDYTSEQLSTLINAVVQRGMYLFNEKMQLLGNQASVTTSNTQTTEQQNTNNNQNTQTTLNNETTVNNETGSIQREHEM